MAQRPVVSKRETDNVSVRETKKEAQVKSYLTDVILIDIIASYELKNVCVRTQSQTLNYVCVDCFCYHI